MKDYSHRLTSHLTSEYLCSQTSDSTKTASRSISTPTSSNMDKASTVKIDDNNDDDDDEESISEILEQCIRNAEDVESEFVREEAGEHNASQGE